jgi:hypothetical protein
VGLIASFYLNTLNNIDVAEVWTNYNIRFKSCLSRVGKHSYFVVKILPMDSLSVVNKLFTLACILLIARLLSLQLTRPEPTYAPYYSNIFDSASSMNDGYWSARDTQIETLNWAKVLEINGEASFNPPHGSLYIGQFYCPIRYLP